MEFKDKKPGGVQHNPKEEKEIIASKIISKILDKYKEDSDFFSMGTPKAQEDAFLAELVNEFGEFDSREVYKQLKTKRQDFEKDDKMDDLMDIERTVAFFEPATLRLDKLLSEVNEIEDINDRKAKIQELKRQFTELLAKRKYRARLHGSRGEKEKNFILTYDSFVQNIRRDFNIDWSGYSSSHNPFLIYFEAIVMYENELKYLKESPKFDRENFEKEKEKYGAKGAFVEILKGLKENKHFEEILVPEFIRIPVEFYTRWKNGEDVSKELERFHLKKFKNKDIIVRSSAVYSEDNENSTGAGIYESIVVPANAPMEEFIQAIIKVYESTESEEARKYREENGINQEEKMGIVVQEHILSTENMKGYVNSVMLNQPELMDVAYDNGLRPVINRKELKEAFYLDDDRRNYFHYQFDNKRKRTNIIHTIATLVSKLETYFKGSIQVEFIEGDNSFEAYVLQARFLPKRFAEKLDIKFPEKAKPILEGMSLGAIDQELDVLEDIGNNSEKEGVVIFQESEKMSMSSGSLLNSFPKKGAVIVLFASRAYGGHIETLCAERGITLIFDTGGNRREIFKHKKLRVVSNGLEAKIYEVKNN